MYPEHLSVVVGLCCGLCQMKTRSILIWSSSKEEVLSYSTVLPYPQEPSPSHATENTYSIFIERPGIELCRDWLSHRKFMFTQRKKEKQIKLLNVLLKKFNLIIWVFTNELKGFYHTYVTGQANIVYIHGLSDTYIRTTVLPAVGQMTSSTVDRLAWAILNLV